MSIRLVIMRHGEYVPGVLQSLTADSRQRCLARGGQLAAEIGTADVVYSSEITRAKETACLVAQGMGYPLEKLVVTTNLSELSSMQQVTFFMHLLIAEAAEKGYQNVVIVTHLPVVEKIMQFFIGEQIFIAPESGIIIEADKWDDLICKRPLFSVWS